MVRAPRLAVSIVGGSGRHESGWVSEEGSFVIAARDAEAFSDQHPSISGAPVPPYSGSWQRAGKPLSQ